METYANQLSLFHGSDRWDAIKKALNLATNVPGAFTPQELGDVLGTINEMNEIENR